MFCTIKVRRSAARDKDVPGYCLQVSAKHAVGGAGGVISDEACYSTFAGLQKALRDLQLPPDLPSAVQATMELEKAEDRWLLIARDQQIAFETLMDAGFVLGESAH